MSSPPPSPRWEDIAAVGSIERWITEQLRRLNLWDEHTDLGSLSASELKTFKARRQEARRVTQQLRQQAWIAFRQAHIVHLGRDIFYHDTPDMDRFDLADPEARRQHNDLPNLKDAQELARALELSIPRLRWLCYHRVVDTGSHYHRWLIPKRDGGQRLISAPKPELKRVQRWIAREITEHLPVHHAVHGFLVGRSTVTNATVHAASAVIVKVDIKDFYPTIHWRRVKGLFRKAGFGEQVATLLALLCTESPREEMVIAGKTYHVAIGPRALPQGAPTSPSITNTLCLRMDSRLTGLAHKLQFRYTRYADDLTFSWPEEASPPARPPVATGEPASATASSPTTASSPPSPPIGALLRGIARIVTAEGFTLHPRKTRIQRSGRRQRVTGLIVNAVYPKPAQAEASTAPAAPAADSPPARVPRVFVRRLRAALHNRLHGREVTSRETLTQLQGQIAYLHMTDPQRAQPLWEQWRTLQAQQAQQDRNDLIKTPFTAGDISVSPPPSPGDRAATDGGSSP